VRLGEKLRVLREVEGTCRQRSQGLSKAETVKLIRDELGERISLAYLSQLETGTRRHMTHKTRQLLARFFRVHPGYLVDDPEQFQHLVGAPLPASRDAFGAWLHAGAARFADDPDIAETLERLALAPDRREALRLFRDLLRTPGLIERLLVTIEARGVGSSSAGPHVQRGVGSSGVGPHVQRGVGSSGVGPHVQRGVGR